MGMRGWSRLVTSWCNGDKQVFAVFETPLGCRARLCALVIPDRAANTRGLLGDDGHRELLRDRAALERRPTHIQRADLCPDLLQRHAVVVDLLVAQGAFGLALQLELAGELHRNLRGYTQKRAKMSATHRNRACVVSCGDVARCQPPPFAGRCATSAPCTVLGCPRQRAKLTVRQEQQSNCS